MFDTRDQSEGNKEILREAARLVRLGWTKGAPARDSQGLPVVSDDPEAVCWCAYGALTKAVQGRRDSNWFALENAIDLVLAGDDRFARSALTSYIHWNDFHATSGEEVAQVFEEAIKFV